MAAEAEKKTKKTRQSACRENINLPFLNIWFARSANEKKRSTNGITKFGKWKWLREPTAYTRVSFLRSLVLCFSFHLNVEQKDIVTRHSYRGSAAVDRKRPLSLYQYLCRVDISVLFYTRFCTVASHTKNIEWTNESKHIHGHRTHLLTFCIRHNHFATHRQRDKAAVVCFRTHTCDRINFLFLFVSFNLSFFVYAARSACNIGRTTHSIGLEKVPAYYLGFSFLPIRTNSFHDIRLMDIGVAGM